MNYGIRVAIVLSMAEMIKNQKVRSSIGEGVDASLALMAGEPEQKSLSIQVLDDIANDAMHQLTKEGWKPQAIKTMVTRRLVETKKVANMPGGLA